MGGGREIKQTTLKNSLIFCWMTFCWEYSCNDSGIQGITLVIYVPKSKNALTPGTDIPWSFDPVVIVPAVPPDLSP